MADHEVPSEMGATDELGGRLPKTMAALRMHEFGASPRPDLLPVPEPGPGELLVKLAASVLSHHDLTVASGQFPVRPQLPYVPGLEGSGRVIQTGRGVDVERLAIGGSVRVFAGGLGATRPGTWAEYVVAPVGAVTPVPSPMPPALAAAGGSVALTAWAATFDLGRLQAGERLGVTGASGAVGSLVLQLAARNGVDSAVAWVRSPDRARLLPDGVEAAFPNEPIEPVDLLVDTVGGPLLTERLHTVRPGGRVVLVGYTAGEWLCLSLPTLMAADVSLLPLNMMRRRLPPDLEASLVADFAEGRLRVAVEVVGRSAVDDAIARLRSGAVSGRVVLEW